MDRSLCTTVAVIASRRVALVLTVAVTVCVLVGADALSQGTGGRTKSADESARRDDLLYRVARYAVREDFEGGLALLEKAGNGRTWKGLNALLNEAASAPKVILKSFVAQSGETVVVGIAGKPRKVKIYGVFGGKIAVGRMVNGRLKRASASLFHLNDDECSKRLAGVSPEARALFLGAMAVRKRRFDDARAHYAKVEGLSGQLSKAVRELEETLSVESPEPSERDRVSDSPPADREGSAPGTSPVFDGDLGELERVLFDSNALAHGSEVAREFAVMSVVNGKVASGQAVLAKFIKQYFAANAEKVIYKSNEREAITAACDAWLVLHHCFSEQTFQDPEITRWLLRDNQRLQLVAEATSEGVVWPRAATIIETLYRHDPDTRDRYFELILAFAVVWDTQRPPLHHQARGQLLPYEPDLPARYDHCRRLYEGKGGVPYSGLNWNTLTFVVDTPVPVSELKWATENVRGSARSWGGKFKDIEYDHDRLESGRFNWPAGPYTLAAIEQRGGICVDQAYYATITARAWGIPAMQFTGLGKRGPHAWFGHMTNQQEWETDAGRYEYDAYTVGRTMDPRTNTVMTDHQAAFACDPVFRSRDYFEACRFCRIADICNRFEIDASVPVFADKARRRVAIYPRPWDVMEKFFLRTGRTQDLLGLLDDRLKTFQRYPDERCAVVLRKAALLKDMRRTDEADDLLADTQRFLGRRRYDLAEKIFTARLQNLNKPHHLQHKMELLEDFLKDNKDEGAKLIVFARDYIRVAQDLGKSSDSARFMDRLLKRLDADFGTMEQFRQLADLAERNEEP
ncbi:MAG: hypothetical protein K9N51_00145 [Candidatus Pacebacteria bacterium]|nr:hypothetical protein [Candidatus Paceibacterota bacterium]